MNNSMDILSALLHDPWYWAIAAIVCGVTYLMVWFGWGRGRAGQEFDVTAEQTERRESEAAEAALTALHSSDLYEEMPKPVIQIKEVVVTPQPNVVDVKARLENLNRPANPPKRHHIEKMVQRFGFVIDVDADAHTLTLVDTRYPTLVRNRCTVPLSLGAASPDAWEQKLKQARMYIERRAVLAGLKPKGTPRKKRAAIAVQGAK